MRHGEHTVLCSKGGAGAEGGKCLDAHSDDLENGEQDGRRRQDACELQHGRDIGRYLGRGDHPVQRIVARAASDGLESHENTSERLGGKHITYGIQASKLDFRDDCLNAMATYNGRVSGRPH